MSYLDQRVASHGAASTSLPSPRCALRPPCARVIQPEAISRQGRVRCTMTACHMHNAWCPGVLQHAPSAFTRHPCRRALLQRVVIILFVHLLAVPRTLSHHQKKGQGCRLPQCTAVSAQHVLDNGACASTHPVSVPAHRTSGERLGVRSFQYRGQSASTQLTMRMCAPQTAISWKPETAAAYR